jgi:ribosomal protein L11 methyltransferase
MTSPQKPGQTRLEILVSTGTEELLPADLYALAGSGIWVEEQEHGVLLKCYPEDAKAFLHCLRRYQIPVIEVRVEREQALDYGELTKRYFRPIRIGGLVVLPPWSTGRKKPPLLRGGKRDAQATDSRCSAGGPFLFIEPGMAFGTGRHESTRIMVKLMSQVDVSGMRVLDAGCGSAILSLYASLLGAGPVIGVDNDVDAIRNARKNVELNGARAITLVCADMADIKGTYDVVLANLDIRTFSAHSKKVVSLVRPGGWLLASGIIGRDTRQLLSLFEPCSPLVTERNNSWRGFLFQIDNSGALR